LVKNGASPLQGKLEQALCRSHSRDGKTTFEKKISFINPYVSPCAKCKAKRKIHKAKKKDTRLKLETTCHTLFKTKMKLTHDTRYQQSNCEVLDEGI
jgi:hypothetical protein